MARGRVRGWAWDVADAGGGEGEAEDGGWGAGGIEDVGGKGCETAYMCHSRRTASNGRPTNSYATPAITESRPPELANTPKRKYGQRETYHRL